MHPIIEFTTEKANKVKKDSHLVDFNKENSQSMCLFCFIIQVLT